MSSYYYCPVLKTRPAEFNAYESLNDSVKNGILPIIEMTGALSYTYPKNYKVKELQNTKRPGDINIKIKKIYSLMQGRKFILDITDDEALMYDGLSEAKGGLLDSTNGYEKWISFLTQDSKFKESVIPTIQFNTQKPRSEIEQQIQRLNYFFPAVAIKLPALVKMDSDPFSAKIQFNTSIERILAFIERIMPLAKLILILDFGYIKNFEETKNLISNSMDTLSSLQKVNAIIPVSSSFPNFVPKNVSKSIDISEFDIYQLVKTKAIGNKVVCGDFASLHPVKYDMSGGGWIPRIDYIITNKNGRPIKYGYERGQERNTSSEYTGLARRVLTSSNYSPVPQIVTEGDLRIRHKAEGDIEGKAPAYWIAVRSNLYMTWQYLYLTQNGQACLSL